MKEFFFSLLSTFNELQKHFLITTSFNNNLLFLYGCNNKSRLMAILCTFNKYTDNFLLYSANQDYIHLKKCWMKYLLSVISINIVGIRHRWLIFHVPTSLEIFLSIVIVEFLDIVKILVEQNIMFNKRYLFVVCCQSFRNHPVREKDTRWRLNVCRNKLLVMTVCQ